MKHRGKGTFGDGSIHDSHELLAVNAKTRGKGKHEPAEGSTTGEPDSEEPPPSEDEGGPTS